MFNERGERSRVHPDDLRFLLLLVKQCREARRQRRAAEAKNLPPDTVAYHRGRCGEALFSLQAAKKLMRVEWEKPVNPLVEAAKFYQRNVITGACGMFRIQDTPTLTHRQRLNELITHPADARLHEALTAMGNDIVAVCVRDRRQLTAEERTLVTEIRHYLNQIEALCKNSQWFSRDHDQWFSSELVAAASDIQLRSKRVTPDTLATTDGKSHIAGE
jgi:hypothetical protein